MECPQTIQQRYTKLKLLGEGAHGKAYLAQSSDSSLWVVKEICIAFLSQKEREETQQQAILLSKMYHPYIVKFNEVYTTNNHKLVITMEFAEGGDLAKKIAEQRAKALYFPEDQILEWFTEICLAIKHVHDRKIIHRDIKGQNIFLTKNKCKLGDFGVARALKHTLDKAHTVVGTPYYLSPQIIENRPYSMQSDIWSLGVLLYELCMLKPPFNGDSIQFLALKIVRAQYDPISSRFSISLRNLVSMMLQKEPSKRPTINQLLRSTVLKNRVKCLLTSTMRQNQFSHTILHNKNILEGRGQPRPLDHVIKLQPPNKPIKVQVKKIEVIPRISSPKVKESKAPLIPGRKQPMLKAVRSQSKLINNNRQRLKSKETKDIISKKSKESKGSDTSWQSKQARPDKMKKVTKQVATKKETQMSSAYRPTTSNCQSKFNVIKAEQPQSSGQAKSIDKPKQLQINKDLIQKISMAYQEAIQYEDSRSKLVTESDTLAKTDDLFFYTHKNQQSMKLSKFIREAEEIQQVVKQMEDILSQDTDEDQFLIKDRQQKQERPQKQQIINKCELYRMRLMIRPCDKTTLNVISDYSLLQSLRAKLQDKLGLEQFLCAYKQLQKELNENGLEQLERFLDSQNFRERMPFLRPTTSFEQIEQLLTIIAMESLLAC